MTFFWFRSLLKRDSSLSSRNRLKAAFRPQLESLEDRCLMTLGNPVWIAEGPTAITDVSSPQIAGDGAVQTVVIDPSNANRAFAATVDGGVWRTTNLTAASPTWTSVTDQVTNLAKPFLGMTDIAFSPLDATNNTLYASTGRFANSFKQPGPSVGVYKTIDGGNTWTDLGNSTLGGLTISNLVPTTLTDPAPGGQVVFAATVLTDPAGGTSYANGKNAGIYRSGDGGQTWSLLSGQNGLPAGDVYQLIADPANAQRFYAALPKQGVYITNDGGASWQATAGNAQFDGLAATTGFRLAVHNSAGNNVLYVATVGPVSTVTGVYRSVNQGASWTKLDLPGDVVKSVNPGAQAPTNVSLAADPSNPNVVFIGGDQAVLFRGDASQPAGQGLQWTSITGAGANGTKPHADTRNLSFDPSGNLLETDDGGLFRLSTPNVPATRVWSYAGGNLAVNAAQSVAYDSVNHIIFGGAQDNGSPLQNTPDSLLYTDASSGDGQAAAVDNTSMPGFSIHYTSAQNAFFFRAVYNGANNPVAGKPLANSAFLALKVAGTGKSLSDVDKTIPFNTILAVNAVDGTRVLLGTNFLYESTDRGDNLTSVGGLTPQQQPKGDIGTIKALAYGGRFNGQNAPDVAYVGTNGFAKDDSTVPLLLLRSQAGGAFNALANYKGSTPLQIVLDPDNWQTGYIVDSANQVWRMTNAGAGADDFTNITGNLVSGLGITGAGGLTSLAIFSNTAAPNDEVLFVGGFGGLAATDNATLGANTQWTAFGTGLPNAPVSALTYDPTENVLVAATFGRGFYEVKNLSNFAGRVAPVVKLNAPAATGNNFATTFTVGGSAVAIADPTLSITDPSSTTLSKVTITLTNPIDGNAELLTANTAGTGITASTYNPVSGQLILSGTDTLANYQKVLATVAYQDTATPVSGNTRILSVAVNDGVTSGQATTTLTIAGAVNAPAVTGGGTTTATAGAATAVNRAPLVITDPVSTTLAGATERIVNLLDAPNEILAATTTGTSITASYDVNTGVLTLAGTDTLAHYQQVLNSVTYDNTALEPNPQSREIALTVNDGTRESLADVVYVDIALVNHAPVLDSLAAFTLDSTNQNATNPPGTFVSDLLDTATPSPAIKDLDINDPQGIAVIGVDDAHGTWQFSIDAGDSWEDFVDVSAARATLLTDDALTLVRFVPNAGFSGTVTNGLIFRAWDLTSGLPQAARGDPEADGGLADTTINGGSSPFSSATATASITVKPVNQPPRFTVGANVTVNANAGPQTITAFAAPLVPGGAGNTPATMTFQVTTDNTSFFQVQPALAPNGTLTFTPATRTSGGTALVTVVAHNNGGTANGGQDSSAAQTFTITVTPADANHHFVQALYQDFLGRSGSLAEMDGWLGQLASLGQQGIASGIAHSSEALGRLVNNLYLRYLGRPANDAGAASWVQQLQGGATVEQVSDGILGSDEFARRANTLFGGANANDNLIRGYYQVVLNRAASADEVNGKLALQPNASAAQVADTFFTAPEFRNAAVRTLYGDPAQPAASFVPNLLHRSASPTATEIQGWSTTPLDLLMIEVGVAASGEYFNAR